jgi:hypothetical protein
MIHRWLPNIKDIGQLHLFWFDTLKYLFSISTYNLHGVNYLLTLVGTSNKARASHYKEVIITIFKHMNKPIEISIPEWQEIVKVPEVREAWGFDDDTTPQECSSLIYGVKFDFISGSPGFCGDLYILQGDSLEAPFILIRVKGQLKLAL